MTALLLLLVLTYSCNKNGDTNKKPISGKYGKICYPKSESLPVYEIYNDFDISIFSHCKEISGVPILFNTKFKDLSFFKGIKYIEGLDIKNNSQLRSLKGLEQLEKINLNFLISDNNSLFNFDALKNLKEVGGNVYIYTSKMRLSKKDQIKFQDHIAKIFSHIKLKNLYYLYSEDKKTITLSCKTDISHGFSCHKEIRHPSQFSK